MTEAWEKELLAIDAAWRAYNRATHEDASIVGLKAAIEAYLKVIDAEYLNAIPGD